jgi:vitamin K-dependent gamma-carboxylase-like protein
VAGEASSGASAWARFWYGPEPARNLAAARILLAAAALWVVLSRHDLPSLLAYPPELWAGVSPERRLRFLMVFGIGVERGLYALLHVALVCALGGIWPRVACFASGLLLYHFAPFETIIRTANPYLRGLTIPCLGLLVLSFSRCGDALALWPRVAETPPPSWEYRWPLRLVQVLFCQIYLFAGWSKLFTTGWSWASAENVRGHLLALSQALVSPPAASWGYAVARHPLACAALAWAGLVLEFAFPLVLFSARARWVLLPAAAVFHAANSLLFRIFFQNVPLLLLFVDWDAVLRGRRMR